MRKTNSRFNSLVEFINQFEPGDIYRTRDMQRFAYGTVERNAMYQTMLKRAGFISNVKRGHWEVLMNIPDWFSLAHLQTLLGHDYIRFDYCNATKVYTKTLRVKITAQEIKDKLNDITPTLRKAVDSYQAERMVRKSLEKKIEESPEQENTTTVERITREESSFYKNPDSHRYSAQLQENLMMNVGYVNSALCIIDQADFLDPVLHGRVLNIFAQLKDLHRTIDERIVYKQHKQTNI